MLRLGTERNELCIVGDRIVCPTYAHDIANVFMVTLEIPNSNQLNLGLYQFRSNVFCSRAEFSQAIFVKALSLEVASSKPFSQATCAVGA